MLISAPLLEVSGHQEHGSRTLHIQGDFGEFSAVIVTNSRYQNQIIHPKISESFEEDFVFDTSLLAGNMGIDVDKVIVLTSCRPKN